MASDYLFGIFKFFLENYVFITTSLFVTMLFY
jgi:hypothetical protein